MSKVLHADDAKVRAVPRLFSENSRAKEKVKSFFVVLRYFLCNTDALENTIQTVLRVSLRTLYLETTFKAKCAFICGIIL